MNIESPRNAHVLAAEYVNSYARLAMDIAQLYVEVPKSLAATAELVRNPYFKPKPCIVVKFLGHAKVDHGKLIGGRGGHYLALQTILRHYGARYGHDVDLQVVEPPGRLERGKGFAPDPNWNDEKDAFFLDHLIDVTKRVFGHSVPIQVFSKHDITHLIFQTVELDPELLAAFSLLWLAIGKNNGREFKLKADEPAQEQAV